MAQGCTYYHPETKPEHTLYIIGAHYDIYHWCSLASIWIFLEPASLNISDSGPTCLLFSVATQFLNLIRHISFTQSSKYHKRQVVHTLSDNLIDQGHCSSRIQFAAMERWSWTAGSCDIRRIGCWWQVRLGELGTRSRDVGLGRDELDGGGHLTAWWPHVRLLLEALGGDDCQLVEGADRVAASERGVSELSEPLPIFEIGLWLQGEMKKNDV